MTENDEKLAESLIKSKEYVDEFMKKISPEIRNHWCEPRGGCACLGCVNISGGAIKAGITKQDWERWMIRNGFKEYESKG